GGDLGQGLFVRVGHRDQPGLRDARGQVARVDAPEPSQPDQPDLDPPLSPGHCFPPAAAPAGLSLVTRSMRTSCSAGTGWPFRSLSAVSTATRPISEGNCATEPMIVPSAMAFLASSTAS